MCGPYRDPIWTDRNLVADCLDWLIIGIRGSDSLTNCITYPDIWLIDSYQIGYYPAAIITHPVAAGKHLLISLHWDDCLVIRRADINADVKRVFNVSYQDIYNCRN